MGSAVVFFEHWVDIGTVVDTEETDRIVNEVVNDAIVAAAAYGQRWDESTLRSLLTIMLEILLLNLGLIRVK